MASKLAGSLEPTDAGKGKWTHKIDANGIIGLSGLADDINKAVDQTVKQVARGKIRVGKLLIEARALFPNDTDFGLWRKEKTLVQSKQHAHYLMQVAERFGDAPKLIEGANYSVMQELVLADQSDIEWVEKRIDDGEPPTLMETRTKVKQTQAERLAPKGTSKKAGTSPGAGTTVTPNTHMNHFVSLSLTMRIKQVVDHGIKGIEGDFIILGLDPDPQIPMHPLNFDAIVETQREESQHGDELRAVNDSAERVMEEFKHWGAR